jgi:hypothetical protein
VARFDVLLLGPQTEPAVRESLKSSCVGVPVIELSRDFSVLDAGEAGAGVLEQIKSRLELKALT